MKPIHSSPKQLQRMLLALQNYNLNVQYKKGKLMWILDTLNRSYRNTTVSWRHDTTEVRSLEETDHAENLPISPDRLNQFKCETPSDKTMQSIIVAINNGWPTSKRQSSHDLAPFYDKRSELVVDNGLVFWRTLSSSHINEKRNADADSPISYWHRRMSSENP
ncbi:Hypothetical predicted protein [Paramuricea clavata]|uniref:Uncharacterized protein n=1 Tax=Paramuricea clavata TaxID=317549 RepID=A0A6S7JT86_PARCT|nr:Hypothetical predicted protein [Paramuricea clavata]